MPRLFVTLILLLLVLTVAGMPQFFTRVAGFAKLTVVDPNQLDEELALEDRDSPRFLAERNRVTVVIPRDMTVGVFLELYQISQEHIRRQIAEQLGKDYAADSDVLKQGLELILELTPPAEEQ